MTSTRRRRAAAFTLFEVMLAATVLVVGLIALMQAVTVGSSVLDLAQKQTVAAQIIHGEIERIHRTNYDQILVPGDNQPVPLPVPAEFPVTTPPVTATELVSIDAITSVKTILVTVQWRGSNGKSYQRSGFTYSGKNGLYVAYQH